MSDHIHVSIICIGYNVLSSGSNFETLITQPIHRQWYLNFIAFFFIRADTANNNIFNNVWVVSSISMTNNFIINDSEMMVFWFVSSYIYLPPFDEIYHGKLEDLQRNTADSSRTSFSFTYELKYEYQTMSCLIFKWCSPHSNLLVDLCVLFVNKNVQRSSWF